MTGGEAGRATPWQNDIGQRLSTPRPPSSFDKKEISKAPRPPIGFPQTSSVKELTLVSKNMVRGCKALWELFSYLWPGDLTQLAEWFPKMHKALGLILEHIRLYIVTHLSFNIKEVEADSQGNHQLHSEFKTSLGYMYPKKNEKNKQIKNTNKLWTTTYLFMIKMEFSVCQPLAPFGLNEITSSEWLAFHKCLQWTPISSQKRYFCPKMFPLELFMAKMIPSLSHRRNAGTTSRRDSAMLYHTAAV